MNDLLAQLNALIANAEANQTAANNWNDLVNMLVARGYGRRITPAQVASTCIDFTHLAELVASTQEVPAPEATKRSTMPRRRLTPADESAITAYDEQGLTTRQISAELNIARSAIITYLGHE